MRAPQCRKCRRLTCPRCGGRRRLIALLTDGNIVRKILAHLGLPTSAPALAQARSPPELEFDQVQLLDAPRRV